MLSAEAIDQAILEVAMVNMPSPPGIVRPFFEVDNEERELIARVRAQVLDAENAVDRFEAEGDVVREKLKVTMSTHSALLTERHLDNLLRMAALLEEKADRLAKHAASSFKNLERANRKVVSIIGQNAGKVLEDEYKHLRATYMREIDANTEMALFLRALKAEYSGDARGGPTFDDSKDLAAYLAKLMA